MKKQFVSNNTRKAMMRFGVAALLMMGSLTHSFATPTKGEEPFVNIKYVGVVDQRAQFQFDMITDNDEAYIVSIQGEDGTVLYKEKVAKKIFTKKFELNSGDLNSSKLLFTVTGEKTKKSQSFEVNAQVRTVQDVVVTKLDK